MLTSRRRATDTISLPEASDCLRSGADGFAQEGGATELENNGTLDSAAGAIARLKTE
jgi:hypothetical protein